MTDEDWQRLVTWIDLNGPCHGTWGEVADIPGRVDRRRHQLASAHGVVQPDPERIAEGVKDQHTSSRKRSGPAALLAEHPQQIARLFLELDQKPAAEPFASENNRRNIGLRGGEVIELVRIPAGRLVMGDTDGHGSADEWPASIVEIPTAFWISRREITNSQFRTIFPEHSSGVFSKRQIEFDGPGVQLDDPNQPAVRVSWDEAVEFCQRVSELDGSRVSLPTEAQWEYAARAGTRSAFWFGELGGDFSEFANMADRSLACLYSGTSGVANLQPIPADMQFDDQAIATTNTCYLPNSWQLFDMHGNAAEWTRTMYRPYPYDEQDGRNDVEGLAVEAKRVVRGGSFFDRPQRCRSAFRLAYPPWQGVHNVGFRVVVGGSPAVVCGRPGDPAARWGRDAAVQKSPDSEFDGGWFMIVSAAGALPMGSNRPRKPAESSCRLSFPPDQLPDAKESLDELPFISWIGSHPSLPVPHAVGVDCGARER